MENKICYSIAHKSICFLIPSKKNTDRIATTRDWLHKVYIPIITYICKTNMVNTAVPINLGGNDCNYI